MIGECMEMNKIEQLLKEIQELRKEVKELKEQRVIIMTPPVIQQIPHVCPTIIQQPYIQPIIPMSPYYTTTGLNTLSDMLPMGNLIA